jgi:hypothetical protein
VAPLPNLLPLSPPPPACCRPVAAAAIAQKNILAKKMFVNVVVPQKSCISVSVNAHHREVPASIRQTDSLCQPCQWIRGVVACFSADGALGTISFILSCLICSWMQAHLISLNLGFDSLGYQSTRFDEGTASQRRRRYVPQPFNRRGHRNQSESL